MKDLITVTDVVENAFCPKFTYYSLVLGLRQYEEKRGTVMAGRTLHTRSEKLNPTYVPKLARGKKLVAMQLYSTRLGLSGKIDEAYESSREIILVERKYTDFTVITDSLKAQIGLLSILLEENRNKPVTRVFVIFQKSKRVVREIRLTSELKNFALQKLESVKQIITSGISPNAQYGSKCLDCTYRKVCPTGSLYMNQ
ncbi:CRISPR-associated exonuclease, Cas4 family [Candidatus Nitrososphaera evergladensis SR1]|uniref:CRISPR-associated exonuclease Cas4 n=1 Tax=Candidatus Nitrososphaera evergladensis SR1 TaxID=1459636 RepID=A0A075MTY5_9ARCH|nr:CRISPR-associated protein Cas4 [Candidatus Nitrososphaera evergladensis]AIF84613.1 CRISPR-associated exonuclease, Cas4 family [Candidatus Nitrososphaera evergladensis SR1]